MPVIITAIQDESIGKSEVHTVTLRSSNRQYRRRGYVTFAAMPEKLPVRNLLVIADIPTEQEKADLNDSVRLSEMQNFLMPAQHQEFQKLQQDIHNLASDGKTSLARKEVAARLIEVNKASSTHNVTIAVSKEGPVPVFLTGHYADITWNGKNIKAQIAIHPSFDRRPWVRRQKGLWAYPATQRLYCANLIAYYYKYMEDFGDHFQKVLKAEKAPQIVEALDELSSTKEHIIRNINRSTNEARQRRNVRFSPELNALRKAGTLIDNLITELINDLYKITGIWEIRSSKFNAHFRKYSNSTDQSPFLDAVVQICSDYLNNKLSKLPYDEFPPAIAAVREVVDFVIRLKTHGLENMHSGREDVLILAGKNIKSLFDASHNIVPKRTRVLDYEDHDPAAKQVIIWLADVLVNENFDTGKPILPLNTSAPLNGTLRQDLLEHEHLAFKHLLFSILKSAGPETAQIVAILNLDYVLVRNKNTIHLTVADVKGLLHPSNPKLYKSLPKAVKFLKKHQVNIPAKGHKCVPLIEVQGQVQDRKGKELKTARFLPTMFDIIHYTYPSLPESQKIELLKEVLEPFK